MKKRLNKKACLAGILAAFLWTLVTVMPTHLPAQDIDDVIEGLDQDFSLGNKQDIKESNKNTANEQLREDVQIQNSELSTNTNTVTISYTAVVDPSHIQVNSVTVAGQTVAINSIETVTGMGTETTTVPVGAIATGQTIPVSLSISCLTGSCNVSASISGVLNCSFMTGLFTPGSSPITVNTTCTT